MIEAMFLRMPAALLLGAILGWLLRDRIPPTPIRLVSVSAFVSASLVMPLWMLPLMMDRAAAFAADAVWRDVTLAATGFAAVLCYPVWSTVLRDLWLLEQFAMLLRYGIWYGFAPDPLCNAWDAGEQRTTGFLLLIVSAVLAVVAVLVVLRRYARATRRQEHQT